MFVVLVTFESLGLQTSLALVAETLKNNFAEKIEVATLVVPEWVTREPAEANQQKILITRPVDAVIFFERMVDHPNLTAARHRILIPNPERLMPHIVDAASCLTEMWHKTHVSVAPLAKALPNLRHTYIGFTSADFSGNKPDFNRFIHFKGSSPQKQTEIVMAAWRIHPEWPELNVQSYVRDSAFLDFPEWLRWRNIRMKYCLLPPDQYRSEVTRAGVHLCPSSVEGFGHYINEARSMGALIVTTNAAPMNELVDNTCGVLVTPVRTEPQNFAVRHIIDVAGFEKAIQTVLDMSFEQRKALGAEARRRYLTDHDQFRTALKDQVLRLAQS
ncbi:MAG: glycosyltransferase [Pseudolabrys sp.]